MGLEILSYVNWVAVILGGLAYFLLGAIWYTALFGKRWKSYNVSLVNAEDAKKGAAGIMVFSFILMIICALGLEIIALRFGVFGWVGGLKLGLLTGICFSATGIHISYIYEKKPLGLHLINGLYNVVGNILAAVIVCVWR